MPMIFRPGQNCPNRKIQPCKTIGERHPPVTTKHYVDIKYTMLSSYRLGDLVLLSLTQTETEEMLTENPDTIGSEFILAKRHGHYRRTPIAEKNNVQIAALIVSDKLAACCGDNRPQLPEDIADSVVIHLRLGDVIAGSAWHELMKRPLAVDYIKTVLENNRDHKYVIGQCFFAKLSSTNYEECVQQSGQYLQTVLDELGAEHFKSGSADADLLCAVSAKTFVQGRGYFSKLIVELRKELGLASIETAVIS